MNKQHRAIVRAVDAVGDSFAAFQKRDGPRPDLENLRNVIVNLTRTVRSLPTSEGTMFRKVEVDAPAGVEKEWAALREALEAAGLVLV